MSDADEPRPRDDTPAHNGSGPSGAPKDSQQAEREAREVRERIERRARDLREKHATSSTAGSASTDSTSRTLTPEERAERDAAKRKRSTMVALGVTAAVVGAGVIAATTLGGDDEEPVTQAAYCVDQTTGTRVEDAQCATDGGGSASGGHLHGWYFIPIGWGAPGIGGRASGGSFATPSGTSYVQGGIPRAGGTVTASNLSGGKTTTVRGGFGSKGGGVGG